MSRQQADRWVVISALVVMMVYGYRRLSESTSDTASIKQILGIGAPPKLGAFATAWGVTYMVIAMMAAASPPLGGAFAILVMTADLLANIPAIASDLKNRTASAGSSAVTTSAAQTVQTANQSATAAAQAIFSAPAPLDPLEPTHPIGKFNPVIP